VLNFASFTASIAELTHRQKLHTQSLTRGTKALALRNMNQ